jgi:hypothetical protein
MGSIPWVSSIFIIVVGDGIATGYGLDDGKMEVREIGSDDMDWIDLAQDRDR